MDSLASAPLHGELPPSLLRFQNQSNRALTRLPGRWTVLSTSPTNRGVWGGQGQPWKKGIGNPSASGITGIHEACAWVSSDWSSQSKAKDEKSVNFDWSLKSLSPCFLISQYFVASNLTHFLFLTVRLSSALRTPEYRLCLGSSYLRLSLKTNKNDGFIHTKWDKNIFNLDWCCIQVNKVMIFTLPSAYWTSRDTLIKGHFETPVKFGPCLCTKKEKLV